MTFGVLLCLPFSFTDLKMSFEFHNYKVETKGHAVFMVFYQCLVLQKD